MKADIQTCQDTFKIGYDAFVNSRDEARKVTEYFHNRQYTDNQLATLANRGQPAETFNVIKLFTRLLLGYYSTVVNTVKVSPIQMQDTLTAAILNDVADYTFRVNNFTSEGDKVKFDGMISGLLCAYTDVKDTGQVEVFGRPIYKIELQHVPAAEIILDPLSRLEDYSDARFIHRFKWTSKEDLIKSYGKTKVEELDSYNNHVDVKEADFSYLYNTEFIGKYRVYDNYLVIHTILIDDAGNRWSIHWSQDTILSKKKITYKEVKFPYRVEKVHYSDIAEYYGLFREIMPTQDAINQALIKIQLMVNTQKAIVEEDAVESIDEFRDAFYRVNAVIPVKSLAGIKIDSLSKEVQDQYIIIKEALDRIQRILSVNDAFLGMAYASDSGAKVKLQQNASMVALRYFTSKLEHFYKLLGEDVIFLAKQYYTAHQVLRLTDEYEGDRWVELNRPALIPNGQVDFNGNPIMTPVFEEVLDPANGEPMTTANGSIIMAPIPTAESEIQFTKADVTVASVSYNDEDEKNQVILEQFINGPVGNMLSQIDPVGYFTAAGLAIKNTKTKYSLELSRIVEGAAAKLSNNMQQQSMMQQGMLDGQGSQSASMNQLNGGM